MRLLNVIFLILTLSACASGTALVTGKPRPPIENWQSVQLLNEMPPGAENIGRVQASSGAGWTDQGSLDYAVEELKKQAAKIGANAIVLSGQHTEKSIGSVPTYQNSGTGMSGPLIFTAENQAVEGIAVFIPPSDTK